MDENSYTIEVTHNTLLATDFEVSFFNTPAYIRFQNHANFYCIAARSGKSQEVFAVFYLFISNDGGDNPYRATFGGIECDGFISGEVIHEMIENIKKVGKAHGLASIIVRSYPCCYHPEWADIIHDAFVRNGFIIKYKDLNQHLTVGKRTFESLLHPSARRRLRNCEKAGFVFSDKLPTNLPGVYDFYKAARVRKGFPVSMDLENFICSLQTFPDRYIFFGVYKNDQLAAMSLGIRVSQKAIYYFIPADAPQYLTYSPALLVIKNMYAYAQKEDCTLLDLGISTVNGTRNEGLINFKQKTGASMTDKLTFEFKF